ncbi:hypothetical protein L6R52_29815 [Myxococcota bacterium]|nr:hypothetical protein [Myxococcota bacterium]
MSGLVKKLILSTALVLGASATTPITVNVARAEEESEKVRKARSENELEKEAESTDAKCGTKLAVSIDWASFDADAAWQGRSVSGYCEAPLGALRSFCEGKNARAHIEKKVKKLVCRAAKDKSGWKVKVDGDTVEWHVSPDSVNNDAYAKNQLLRTL